MGLIGIRSVMTSDKELLETVDVQEDASDNGLHSKIDQLLMGKERIASRVCIDL